MKICILGAGAYGLALALTFYKNKNQVVVWTKLDSEKEIINSTRYYQKVLPDIYIPEEISITSSLECLESVDLVVFAVPITFFRSTCLELKEYLHKDLNFCIATKGIENDTGLFAHQILEQVLAVEQISVISGPTFAIDLANSSISGLTLASNNESSFQVVANSFSNSFLTIENCHDMIGVEICGAVKNIMAIIAGMLDGMKQTETTKALFLTKALHEIGNLISHMGGKYETIYTFAGVGDLLLTCNSRKSRNYSLGLLLVEENEFKIQQYIQQTTVEGYYTLLSIYPIIQKYNIDCPFINCLYKILFMNQKKKELLSILTLT